MKTSENPPPNATSIENTLPTENNQKWHHCN